MLNQIFLRGGGQNRIISSGIQDVYIWIKTFSHFLLCYVAVLDKGFMTKDFVTNSFLWLDC